MRLTADDRAAISAGELEIRRPVKYRKGRRLACPLKRGDIAAISPTECAHVVSIRTEGDEWVARVELLGAWALRSVDGPRRSSLSGLERDLPGVLSWKSKPDVEVGDIFVFDWVRLRDHYEGQTIHADEPAVWIEVTSVNRNRKGEWVAHYRKHGFDRPKFMAPKLGYTTNRSRAISDAEVPELRDDPVAAAHNETAREIRRLETLRAGLQQKLMATANPRKQAVVVKAIADTETKLRRLQGLSEKSAA